MLKKIFFVVSILILAAGCDYKPIYSVSNKSDYKIVVTDISGDKKINKFLINNLNKNSRKNSGKIINIKIDSEYSKIVLAKDVAGNITDYQSKVITTFIIEQNQTSKSFVISEKFNFQNMSDKYEEKSYEENIKRSLATTIAQKLIIRLSIE